MILKPGHPLARDAQIFIDGLLNTSELHQLVTVDTDKGEYVEYVVDSKGRPVQFNGNWMLKTRQARIRVLDPNTGYEWCSYDRDDLVEINPIFLP